MAIPAKPQRPARRRSRSAARSIFTIGTVALVMLSGTAGALAQPTTTPAPTPSAVPGPASTQRAPAPVDPCATPDTTAPMTTTTAPPTTTATTTAAVPAPLCETVPPVASSSTAAPIPTGMPAPEQAPASETPAPEQAPTSDAPATTKIPYTGLPTENPNDTVVPGKMRSDREEFPEGFTKDQADQAEIFEAELLKKKAMQRGVNALAAPTDCRPYWPTNFQVCGEIRLKYDSLGGSTSFLGPPSANDVANPDNYGRRQTFWNGPIYWSPATGAHPVVNSFLNRWGVHQYESGWLKYPTTDEIVLPDGGRRQEFQQGAIYVAFQNAIGSAIANGPLRDKYNSVGGLAPGGTLLGYLIEDHKRTLPDGQGQMARFQNGVIYWSPNTGAHTVLGGILTKWSQRGYEGGALGYPTSDGLINADGVGQRQEFQNAAIYYHPSRGLASSIGGEIRNKWNSLGAEAGDLGYPTSDEVDIPQELAFAGTRMNTFEAGIIAWSPSLGASDGQWYAIEGSDPGVASRQPEQPGQAVKIRPGNAVNVACPAETIHDADSEYSCETAWPNHPFYGGKVISRFGRPDAFTYPGHGAFGSAHALEDHNLGLNAMGKIVNFSRRVPFGTQSRVFYQAEFRIRDSASVIAQVRVQEIAMTEEDREDEYAMGVVTGYCKTGSEAGEGYCAPWVNATLR